MLRAHNWAQISKSAWHPAVLTETFLWPDNQNCSAWWKLGSLENLATYFNAQMEAGLFRKAGSYITVPVAAYQSCKYLFFFLLWAYIVSYMCPSNLSHSFFHLNCNYISFIEFGKLLVWYERIKVQMKIRSSNYRIFLQAFFFSGLPWKLNKDKRHPFPG